MSGVRFPAWVKSGPVFGSLWFSLLEAAIARQ